MDQVFDSRRLMDAALCYYLRAWYELMRDDLNKASELVRAALDLGQRSGNQLFAAVCRNDMGRILFYAGSEEDALQQVRLARNEGRQIRANTVEYLTWLAEAELQWRKNDIVQCIKSLRACLKVGREMNFRNHTWWDAKIMRSLYALALEHDIEAEYVRSVIQQRGLTCDESVYSDKWPRPVKMYSFGAFRLLLNDQPVQVSGKAQLRPLSLLKALIALGGQSVSQEQLCDALWPDSEGDAAKRTLHSNIFRARKLLQHEDALIVREERVSLDPRLCWVDTWALEHGLKSAEESSDMTALTRVLDLYRGDFLAGEDESWAIDYRERIRAKLVRRLTAVCRDPVTGRDLRKVVRYYERGLEIDPTAETFYQELMRLYQSQGRRSDAIALYQRCEAALKRQLGQAPSEATRRLYRQI
jgi:DNA-binding SARP family transcriptional activator